MRCYLVRHAQTIWNHENRIQGHADPPLSPLGLEQATRLGEYFAARSIGALYTSGLTRSVQTAHVIASHTGLTPIIEPALAEINLGSWEGLTPEEVDARFAGAYQTWRVTPSQVTIPGAESLGQFRARIRNAITQILSAYHDEGELVIVSHGGVIAALLSDWLGADYDHLLRRLTLDNAGISALDRQTNPPQVLWVNATDHLTNHLRSIQSSG
jgi:alpha-ribazole phosphatase/probable phosphoglycerate mutase